MIAEKNDALIEALRQENELQRQLIEAQNEVIRLYKKMESLVPPKPDKDVHWHQVSDGTLADDVIKSGNLQQVQALQTWMLRFGEKYIKPFVHIEAYAEMIAHMTRGVPQRLAELEVTSLFGMTPDEVEKTVDFEDANKKKPRKTRSTKTKTKAANDSPST